MSFASNVSAEEINSNESNCSSSSCIIDSFLTEINYGIKVFNSSSVDITEDFYAMVLNHYVQNEKDI